MHRESKSELTDRLRREGRFEEFKKRREQLKAERVPAKEAWWRAAVEFPPENGNGSNGSAPKVDLSPLRGKPAVKVIDAAAWVFEHLDCDWITPADAPSAGAWSLLQWARSGMMARSEFYRNFANKVVSPPQEAKKKAEDDQKAHHRKVMARLFGDKEPEPEPAEEKAQRDALIERLRRSSVGEEED